MPTLKSQIDELAEALANGILAAVRNASLSELTNVVATARKTGTTKATTPKTTGDVSASVYVLLKNHPTGLRSEQIQKALGIKKPAAVKALAALLGTKHVKKTGQKRATTYHAR